MAIGSSQGGLTTSAGIWRYSKDSEVRRPLTHPAAIMAAQFSPDAKLLLTGCADGAARLWETTSGELLAGPLFDARFKGLRGLPTAMQLVAFSDDGHLFATSRADTIQVWNTQAKQPVGQPFISRRFANSLNFANKGTLLAVSSDDSSISLWDIQGGKPTLRFQGSSGIPALAVVSSDGSMLAGTTNRETVEFWNCNTGKKRDLPPLVHLSKVTCLRFSREGDLLAVGTEDGAISLWMTESAGLVWRRRISSWPVQEVRFAKALPELAVLSTEAFSRRSVSILHRETGDLVVEPIELPVRVKLASWLGDANALAMATADGIVRLWQTESPSRELVLPHRSQISSQRWRLITDFSPASIGTAIVVSSARQTTIRPAASGWRCYQQTSARRLRWLSPMTAA